MHPEKIKFKGATYIRVAESKSWYDYELEAQKAFLLDLAKQIREVAGGHAETVEVKRGRSVVWLEYEGQDLADLDMQWRCHMVTDVEPHTVGFYWTGKSVNKGDFDGDAKYKTGEFTVDHALAHFKAAFGAR
jgi:hypothetical protein